MKARFWKISQMGLNSRRYPFVGILTLLAGCSRPATNAEPTVVPIAAPEAKSDPVVLTPEPTETALTLTGTVQAGARVTLTARQPARIVSVAVKQGETVAANQVLVRLDDAEVVAQEKTAIAGITAAIAQLRKAQAGRDAQVTKADSDIAAAQSGVEQAQGRWEQAKSGVEAAKSQDTAEQKLASEGVHKAEIALKRAQEQWQGLEELAKVGGVARNDLEGARTQVQVAQSDLDTARTQAQQGRNPAGIAYRVANAAQDAQAAKIGFEQAQTGLTTARKAKADIQRVAAQDVEAARAAVSQARAGAAAANSAKSSFRLVSPIGGIAADVAARVGETAQPGMPFVTVVSLSGFRVEALVTARQLSRLHVGQAAQIQVETQAAKPFSAAVSEIARSAEPDGRTFRVQFRFSTNVTLRPGQTARITLP